MNRRHFLIKFFLWVLSIVFGYKVGFDHKEDEVLTKDGSLNKIENENEGLVTDTLYINALYPPSGCPSFRRNDSTYDNSIALQWIYTNLKTLGSVKLYFPKGSWEFKKTIKNKDKTIRHLIISGVKNASVGDNGTMLNYTGTGPFIELGRDSGNLYSANEYDGVGNLTVKNVFITHSAPDTIRLGGGGGTYKVNSYGIRDWRGGDIILDDITLQGFEYGFWGIQSDMNYWRKLHLRYNKVAMYVGPRSDQLTCNELYAYSNDTVLKLDGVAGARFNNCQFVANGSPTTAPIDISSDLKPSVTVTFNDCWFENYVLTKNKSFIDIGMTGSVMQENVNVCNPIIKTTSAHTTSFLRLKKARSLSLTNIAPLPAGSLSSFLKYEGVAPDITMVNLYASAAMPVNYIDKIGATGSIRATTWSSELGVPQIGSLTSSRWGFLGNSPNKYFEVEMPNDRQFRLTFNKDSVENKIRLDLTKRIIQSDEMPKTGTWEKGDRIINTNPSELGENGNRYIIEGWIRLTNSNSNVLNKDWFEMRVITGN